MDSRHSEELITIDGKILGVLTIIYHRIKGLVLLHLGALRPTHMGAVFKLEWLSVVSCVAEQPAKLQFQRVSTISKGFCFKIKLKKRNCLIVPELQMAV